MLLFIDTEAMKHASPVSRGSSSPMSVRSYGSIPPAGAEYGKMMCEMIEILENNEKSLTKKKRAFVHMAHYVELAEYTDIIQSPKYDEVDSVEMFFKLLAPHLKPPDCSLLIALVNATDCEKAKQRLTEYLDKSNGIVLAKTIENSHISPPENAPKSTNAAADSNSVTSPEPAADSNAVPVTTRVIVCEMSWGVLRRLKSIFSGLFRIPQCALKFLKGESGSITITWTTSSKMALQMQSVVLDDGDMKLLLQERIVSVHVGLDYKILVGSEEYWRVSQELHI